MLRAESDDLKKEIESLKAEKKSLLPRTEVEERSFEHRMQEFLASEATLRVELSSGT